jgi:hypothetical protein
VTELAPPKISPFAPELSRAERIGWWVALALALAWIALLFGESIPQAFRPYVAETDWKQATWHYWRYSIDGAFPEGHLLTDFAFATHGPPVWWFLMATFSWFFDPIIAANILHICGFLSACVAMYFVVLRFTNHYVALVASVLVVRMPMYFAVASGGFARSFGMSLVLGFLALWVWGKHRWVLAMLILQAGFYPSAVIPCGLAYGLFLTYRALRHKEWRPFFEVCATGVVVILIGVAYDQKSEDWWGSMMTVEQAWTNEAVQSGGRSKWVPMPRISGVFESTLTNPFRQHGPAAIDALAELNRKNRSWPLALPFFLMAGFALIRKRIPVPLLMLFGSAAAGFFLARGVAFKLYLPRRVLQHSYGALSVVLICIGAWVVVSFLMKKREHAAKIVAALVIAVPILLVAGPGARPHNYRSYKRDAPLYEWVAKNTPITAQFAGNYQILDEIPLFAQRQVFINWKMAHPFRFGYYAEVERRTLAMYKAYYATDWETVLDFCEQEKIDYIIWDKARFQKLERGDGQLFRPLRAKVAKFFRAGKGRFVLPNTPEEAMVYKHRRKYRVVDVAKLRAWYTQEQAKPKPVEAPEGQPGADAGPSPTDAGP